MTALRPFLLVAGLLAFAATAAGQTTYTWQPTTDGLWSTASNWKDQNSNSVSPVSAATTTLNFGGSTAYTATNDIGAGTFTANVLNFSGSGAKTITGAAAANTITLAGSGAAINVASGTGATTISAGLVVSANATVTNSSSNLLTFGAVTYNASTAATFAGSGNITAGGTQTFQNNSSLTYTGTGTLTLGPTAAGSAFAFGTGNTVSISNGTSGGGNTGTLTLADTGTGSNYAGTTATINLANYSSGAFNIGNMGGVAGTLNINAGTVRFAGNTGGDLFGSSLTLNVAAGATFDFNGNGESMGAISGNGTITGAAITMGLTGNRTWGGVYAGTGAFSTGATGVNYTFTGNNTSTGATTVVAGSSLTLGNGGTTGTVGGTIANAGTLTVNRSDAFTFGNVISGVGVVNVTGTGTTTLGATNTYTGATTVSNGTLRVVGRTAASAYTVNDGAGIIFRNTAVATPFATSTLTAGTSGSTTLGFELNGGLPSNSQFLVNVATSNGLTLNGTSTVNVSSTGVLTSGQYALIKYAGAIQGTGGFGGLSLNTAALPFRVTGSLVNNTANTSIDVNIASDFIKWNGNVAGQNWNTADQNWLLNSNNSATTYFENPGANQVDSGYFDDTATNFTVNLPGTVNPNAVTVNTAGTYTFQGAGKISGTAGLTKQGTGTLILATDNDYTGGTTVAAGTLQLGNGGTTGSVAGTISGSGTVTVNRSDNYTFANALAGTVGFANASANPVTLGGTSTTTGPFTFNAGTGAVSVSAQANLGGNSTLAFNGGTLNVTGNIDTSGSGSAATQQIVVNAAGGTINIAPGILFNKRGDQVIGSGTLTVTGGGIFGMGSAGTSTLTRLDINQGGFRLTSQRTGSLGALNLAAGTTLFLLDTTSFTVAAPFSIASGATINLSGGDGIAISGVSGNANILGTSTGSGAYLHILDEAGSATAGIGSAINLTGQNRFTQLNVRAGSTVTDTVTDVFQGVIGGTGGIVKDGNGTMLVTANNTFTGGVTVANGTFGGTGTVASAVTVNTPGTGAMTALAPGFLTSNAAGGTLTVSAAGGVTVQSGAALAIRLGATAGTADSLALTNAAGTLNLASGSKLNLSGTGAPVGGSYTIATLTDGNNLRLNGTGSQADGFSFGKYVQGTGATGAVVIAPTGFTLTAGDTFELNRVGNNLVLSFTPVPEPATVLAVGAAGLGALSWLRRRRKAASA